MNYAGGIKGMDAEYGLQRNARHGGRVQALMNPNQQSRGTEERQMCKLLDNMYTKTDQYQPVLTSGGYNLPCHSEESEKHE